MLIVFILWCIIGTLHIITYLPAIAELDSWWDKVIISAIFFIGGVLFAVVGILESVIEAILGDGWDDEDDNKPNGI